MCDVSVDVPKDLQVLMVETLGVMTSDYEKLFREYAERLADATQ